MLCWLDNGHVKHIRCLPSWGQYQTLPVGSKSSFRPEKKQLRLGHFQVPVVLLSLVFNNAQWCSKKNTFELFLKTVVAQSQPLNRRLLSGACCTSNLSIFSHLFPTCLARALLLLCIIQLRDNVLVRTQLCRRKTITA